MTDLTEGHIFKRYDGELGRLRDLILEMGDLVRSQVAESLVAFSTEDVALAQTILVRDGAIDQLERDADGEVARVIALHGPFSNDLRLVLAVSKSLGILERIGDEAVRIAELVSQFLGDERDDRYQQWVSDIRMMGDQVVKRLLEVLEPFETWQEGRAVRVIKHRTEMALEFQTGLRGLMSMVLSEGTSKKTAIGVVLVAKALERIEHQIQNLAEFLSCQGAGRDAA